MNNLNILKTKRLKKRGKPKWNITVILMLVVAIFITLWKLKVLTGFSKYLTSAENVKTHHSLLSGKGPVFVLLRILFEFYEMWFQLCSFGIAVFIATLCFNLHQEFEQSDSSLQILVESRTIYTNNMFAQWRNTFENIAHLVESININISLFLCYDILSLLYGMLAAVYNVLQDCDTNWWLFFDFTLKLMFPLLMLVLSTIAVNEKVGHFSNGGL